MGTRVGLCAVAALGWAPMAWAEGSQVDFARDVLPVLADRCFACHGPDTDQRKADLRLDVEAEAKTSAIVAGDADASELLARITASDPDKLMPPPDSNKLPLSPEQIDVVRAWIEEGASWGQHWSHVPPRDVEPPSVTKAEWPRNAIDNFILARLEEAGLDPSPVAARETLVRRLSFDLTGLPPSLETIDAFLADDSAGAYERLVDRLLATTDYGEHMAREWLDGARYADTNGYQNDFKRNMWPWRDWLIEAFNENMPFDQFIVEQVAGDLLPNATNSQRIATGFYRNNRSNTEGGSIEAEWHVENIVDRLETTGAVFLGLSIGCARCHDHKYDPVSREEFYEFFAFFNSTADKGFYEETRGNTGPIVSLPTYKNQLRVAEYDREIDLIEYAIESAKTAEPFEFMAWRSRLARSGGEDTVPEMHYRALSDDTGGVAEGFIECANTFDGSPERIVDLGQSVTFERFRPFTVSLWMRPEGSGAVFSKMNDENANRGVDLLISDNDALSVHLVNAWPDNAIKVTTGNNWIRKGVWTHVCVTYDGSSKAKGVQLYVNGVAAPLETEKGTLSDTIATAQPLRIGSRSAGANFKGAVADFRYIEEVLEPDGIRALSEEPIRQALADGVDADTHTRIESYFALLSSYPVREKQKELDKTRKDRSDYQRVVIPSVMVLEELPEPRPTYFLNRGAYDAPDLNRRMQPGVPAFLPPLPEGAPPNRLGLAKWLVDESHPLTARVVVNRYWQMLFGRGIVKTSEDFGIQGDPPTHPDMLDWLTRDFVNSGWDLKHLFKRMVTSATYRQSSALNDRIREIDPEGILLASAPRFRFPAEVVRDNALAVSGLLTRKIGGPSVKPYQPDGLWEELAGGAGEGPYVMAKGEDLYRRSLYTYRKRTVPPPTLTTFDAPGWDICRVRRSRTNTPLQALALLNDVTYAEAARHLAQRMILEGGADSEDRIVHAYRLVMGRRPEAAELDVLTSGLDGYLESFAKDTDAAAALVAVGNSPCPEDIPAETLAAYTTIASVVMNLDEAITRE